ncbi:MAG: zinc-binding dehydrogenase [Pirellulaceae bacterium]
MAKRTNVVKNCDPREKMRVAIIDQYGPANNLCVREVARPMCDDNQVLMRVHAAGVGSFAVQIGKAMGANVTGVRSESNLDFVRQLGADQVIDYHCEDFTNRPHRYDTILDAVAKSSYWKCRRVLRPHGCYIRTVPSIGSMTFQWLSLFLGRRCRNILVRPRGEDLQQIAQMMADGNLRPVVQEVYPLEEAATAHRVSEAGHVRGKLVLSI